MSAPDRTRKFTIPKRFSLRTAFAIEAGYVDAWQHSNARRSFERRVYRPRRPPLLRNRRGRIKQTPRSPLPQRETLGANTDTNPNPIRIFDD